MAYLTPENFPLFDVKKELLAVVNDQWFMVELTDSWVETLGYDRETLLNTFLPDLIHPDDLKNTMVYDKYNASIVGFTNRYRKKDGDYVHLRWRVTPLGTDNLSITFAENITEEVRLKEELERERSKNMHAAKLSALGEMAGGIAHEINNPLNIISGHASLIELQIENERPDTKIIKQQLDKLFETVERIAKIVSGMKKFTHTAPTELEGAVLKDIYEDTVLMCSEKFKNAGIIFEGPQLDSGLFVYCKSIEISQVLLNLLSNAFDAVYMLKEERRIQVRVLENNDLVYIDVIDNGAQIADNLIEKLFEPFFTTKEVGKGTGLGLSISKSIMDSNHGNLEYLEENNLKFFRITLQKFTPEIDFD